MDFKGFYWSHLLKPEYLGMEKNKFNLEQLLMKIFYGLHVGNNQNSIWKPHSNFAFPEP